ncbi:UNVERIFIED_CONTAM: hypothetical protein Sradi_3914800 [Sesamum radiatum]|uniref:PX domain-containing protein n=1 Tax=Sesamum radiatum TaxID=300843 RepID=A0AAW2PEW4_SESRA
MNGVLGEISSRMRNINLIDLLTRYQHFEELHRRLKEFPEYNLHLPPKHFLSTGLDVFVIQERCKLLDQYLKKLLQLPTVSCSIEVWDFLSVDSQMYIFSDSLSIIDTLSDKAPAAIVGLVGRKEYEQCAKDLYYFIQSAVFMKQLSFDLLELLLLSAFPELDYVFRQFDQDKQKFGELKLN